MRRYLLDSLRRADVSRCEELLDLMDNIYTELFTMDFPEAITAGLRRTTGRHAGHTGAHPRRLDHGTETAEPGRAAYTAIEPRSGRKP